jgi:eukaryotic-like serine/threonine-protein kinase
MNRLPRKNESRWIERESFIEPFETAYAADPNVDIDSFVPPPRHPFRLKVLEELVRIDLEHHWLRGEPRWLEDYFHRFPELFDASAAVRTLAFEEYRMRRRAGHAVHAEEYRRRFGIDPSRAIRDDMPETGLLLETLTPKPPPDRFAQLTTALPRVGDCILDYQLIAELGAGAFGQVFLAHKRKSQRPVAIKVIPQLGSETAAVVRLRHPHIVPIRSVHRTSDVQAVVMPYRGAVTLAHAQLGIRSGNFPTSGAALFAVQRQGLPAATTRGHLVRPALVAASYFDAAIWLVARLADGLAHAHSRGLLHRDLKPANVLIADDGTPMLLDFNLATAVRRGDKPYGPSPGGTLPYMSPEQLDAFIGNPRTIDPRADLYGLGVILFQLLTGRMPYPAPHDLSPERLTATLLVRLRPAPLVRSINSNVPAEAEDIVKTLLQPDPDLRLTSAKVVRDRLDAIVPHLPKRPPNWRERVTGWLRSTKIF